MWTYIQRTGQLYRDGKLIATGYSGHDVHKNIPEDDHIPMLGPCPKGFYTIGSAYQHPKLGPVTMNLDPDPGDDMHGRAAFRIHGDNKDHTASEGCLIFDRATRMQIEMSGDRKLQIVADYAPESV